MTGVGLLIAVSVLAVGLLVCREMRRLSAELRMVSRELFRVGNQHARILGDAIPPPPEARERPSQS